MRAVLRISVRVLSAVAVTALAGCDRDRPDTDPPTEIQIACTPRGAADPVLVLVLDTGRKTAVLANGPDAPTGALSVTDHEYALVFKDLETSPVWTARINRYDGRMERRVETPAPGPGAPQDVTESWTCAPQKPGRKF